MITDKEAIDYLEKELEYMRYHYKDELVEICERSLDALKYKQEADAKISRLRADRDRLEKALEDIRKEIVARDRNVKSVRSDGACFFNTEEVLKIIDKYKEEVR